MVTAFFLGCSNYTTIEKEAINSMKQEIKAHYNEKSLITFDNIEHVFSNDSICIIWVKYTVRHEDWDEEQNIDYTYCVSNGHKYSLMNPCVRSTPPGVPASKEYICSEYGSYISEKTYDIIKDSILPNKNLNYKDAQAYLAIKQLNQSGREINSEDRWRKMIPTQYINGQWELIDISDLSSLITNKRKMIALKSANTYDFLVNPVKPILTIIVDQNDIWLYINQNRGFTLTAQTTKNKTIELGGWDNFRFSQYTTCLYAPISTDTENIQSLLADEKPFTLTLDSYFILDSKPTDYPTLSFDFYPQGFKEALKQL